MIGRTPVPHEPEPWPEARVSWRDVGCAWVFVLVLFVLYALALMLG
jgi:hypothetical protein